MKKNRKQRTHIDGSRLITIVSVALVLLVVGVTMMLGFGTDRAARLIRSNLGVVAVIDPLAGQASVDSLKSVLASAPYTQSVEERSADQVLERWEAMMGPEEMLDVNPFMPEIELTVHNAWAGPDSLGAIAARIEKWRCVDHVETHSEIAAGLNHSLSSVILILSLVGLTLLVVSVVLIANTVKLQLHSQRFIIHTQQYVGATPGYIVRPYVRRSALNGLTASVAASALLAGLLCYVAAIDPVAATLISWEAAAVTAATLVVTGVGLCALTARLAAMKYVKRSYDEIFE